MRPPFHRLEEFVRLTSDDRKLIESWCASPRRVPKGNPIRREGDPVAGVFLLISGWVTSSIMLRDGRRQITRIHLSGDMPGFPSLALTAAGETLEALTDVTVGVIPNAALGKMFDQSPRFAAGMFLNAQKERYALMQRLTWIGAASAQERMGAFLLDLYERLEAAGLVSDKSFEFPLTQQHLGEVLGLTAVHVNRVLKRFDHWGIVLRRRGSITILDPLGLRALVPNFPPQSAGEDAWARLQG